MKIQTLYIMNHLFCVLFSNQIIYTFFFFIIVNHIITYLTFSASKLKDVWKFFFNKSIGLIIIYKNNFFSLVAHCQTKIKIKYEKLHN